MVVGNQIDSFALTFPANLLRLSSQVPILTLVTLMKSGALDQFGVGYRGGCECRADWESGDGAVQIRWNGSEQERILQSHHD